VKKKQTNKKYLKLRFLGKQFVNNINKQAVREKFSNFKYFSRKKHVKQINNQKVLTGLFALRTVGDGSAGFSGSDFCFELLREVF
jgi:hypothetical protein